MKGLFLVCCAILAADAFAAQCGGSEGVSGRPENQCKACKALADSATTYTAFSTSECKGSGGYCRYTGDHDDVLAEGVCDDPTVIASADVPTDLTSRFNFITAMCKCQTKKDVMSSDCFAGCTSVSTTSVGNSGAWRRAGVWSDTGEFANVCSPGGGSLRLGANPSKSLKAAKTSLAGKTINDANWAQTCLDSGCCTKADLSTMGVSGFSEAEIAAEKCKQLAEVEKLLAGAGTVEGLCAGTCNAGGLTFKKILKIWDPKTSSSSMNEVAQKLKDEGLCEALDCTATARFKTAFRNGQKITEG